MANPQDKEKEVLLSFAERVDRNDPGALNNLGVLYFRKKMHLQAIQQFKEALKIDPKFDLARDNLLFLFRETGMVDPDVERWQAEVDADASNTDAQLRLGVSYQNMGRFKEAEQVFRPIVESNEDHVLARMRLGNVLKSLGSYQEALSHYLHAEEQMAKHAVYHTDLGEIYYNLGRTEDAIESLNTAIKLDGEYWRSHFLLSFAYGDEGRLQEALDESRISSTLNPSFQNTEANLTLVEYGIEKEPQLDDSDNDPASATECPSFMIGNAYRERGYLTEAINEFMKAAEEMPDKDRPHLEIARIYLLQGDLEQARASLAEVLNINPECAEAFKLMGCYHHQCGDVYDAAVNYLQALRLSSTNPDVMNNLGVVLYQVGLIEEAEKLIKKGLNLNLYHRELNYNLLNCMILKNEYLMAESLMQRLAAYSEKLPLYYERRALLNYKMNRVTQAHEDIEKAINLDANHHDAIYLKGLICLREENYRGAIDAVITASKLSKDYTGLNFMLSMTEGKSISQTTVENIPLDPSAELIELLEAGIARRFDLIRETLTKATAVQEPAKVENPAEKIEPENVSKKVEDDELDGEAFDSLEEITFDLEFIKEESE
jgi:tetratricopeptide (TPR) repeat protein